VARATALQSDSSSLGTLINERAVQDLPINGRNFFRLAQLSAGANEDGTTRCKAGTGRMIAAPVPPWRSTPARYNNNFMIDGLDNKRALHRTIVAKAAIDALAEFKLYTNAYAAELGRTAGALSLGDQVRHEHVSRNRCTSSFATSIWMLRTSLRVRGQPQHSSRISTAGV